MKIVFFSEMNFNSKVPRDHPNMRVEFAQMCALEADHRFIGNLWSGNMDEHWDIAILLIPKTMQMREMLYDKEIVDLARKYADKVVFMQEGPHWIYQDFPLHLQFWHVLLLKKVDGILCENRRDIFYYKGICPDKPVMNILSTMITDYINVKETERKGVIMSGTFTRWYGGMDSFIVAKQFEEDIWSPSMGRKNQEDETVVVNKLPYMVWSEWMHRLNDFKYGVNMMPTFAAGTFSMNCGYLGIPCIGYSYIDTQKLIFPDLSVYESDLYSARQLAIKLKDKSFYEDISLKAKENYQTYFSESVFLKTFYKFVDLLYDKK